uniref:Uncharacterized protein n=1 Tax=Lactuca sativa TaxID=4236 RepID=A0A9R1UHS9_LACSA|nr:hypothetical protein LSAT_V11C900464820 [Lactuca sativa]
MQYTTPDYTCFGVDISNDINFVGLIMLVSSKSMLHTNQMRLSFQCPGSNIVMQILDDSDVKYFLSFVSSMPPNKVQLFIVSNVMESGNHRFVGENCSGGNGSSGAGRNQMCNLLPITTNHVPSYNRPIDGGEYRNKDKVVIDASPTVDIDESANDDAKIMMLVDNDSEEIQTTPWGMPEPLPSPELAQQKSKGATAHNYTSYIRATKHNIIDTFQWLNYRRNILAQTGSYVPLRTIQQEGNGSLVEGHIG